MSSFHSVLRDPRYTFNADDFHVTSISDWIHNYCGQQNPQIVLNIIDGLSPDSSSLVLIALSKYERGNGAKKRERFLVSKVVSIFKISQRNKNFTFWSSFLKLRFFQVFFLMFTCVDYSFPICDWLCFYSWICLKALSRSLVKLIGWGHR